MRLMLSPSKHERRTTERLFMADAGIDSTRHFDGKRAQVYDDLIRQVVPGYEVLHALAGLILKDEVGEHGKVLVVGAGTGQEVLAFAEERPHWHLTGVEPAPDMIALAKERVTAAGWGERIDLVTGYVHDLPETADYDAAALLLVMHFLPDDGAKLDLLTGIAKRLKPGAPLVLADLHADMEGPRFRRFMALWRQWQLGAGIEPDKVEKGFQRMIKDIQFVSERRILGLLAEAGFVTVEPFYGAFLFGAWIAWKAA